MHQYWYEGSKKATKTPVSVKLGVLSSAMINPAALFHPATSYAGAEVIAIASRDEGVAQKTAKSYGIPKSVSSYEALLADPEVEAVYISLPNGLHGGECCEAWIRAIRAILISSIIPPCLPQNGPSNPCELANTSSSKNPSAPTPKKLKRSSKSLERPTRSLSRRFIGGFILLHTRSRG